MATSNFAQVNNINLHYLDEGDTGKPALLLMHGLTANGHAFDAIVPGLSKDYRVICPDLRGNGLSDKPAFCYRPEDHVQDILGLISHLGLEKLHIGGHSFGGYMAFYIAACHPDVVDKLVILDAAKSMNPRIAEMLAGAVGRLSATYPSFDEYIAQVKKAEYMDIWDDAMLSYYQADVETLPDGSVKPRANIMDISEKSAGLAVIDWEGIIKQVTQPTLLINALDSYTLGEPLLPDFIAKETVAMMPHATYAGVDGNHQTMLYGPGARQIATLIVNFLSATQ